MNARWRAPAGLHTASARLPVEGELPSFGGATGWLDSPPLTPAGLRGKVALVDFWTYTCINWLRQLPYVRAWAGKYSGRGLVVIGVHTPAIFTWSWGRPHRTRPCDSACSSTGSHLARHTAPTLTAKATERWPNSDCTSSSASAGPSPPAPSRSPSLIPASRRTRSPSGRWGGPAMSSRSLLSDRIRRPRHGKRPDRPRGSLRRL